MSCDFKPGDEVVVVRVGPVTKLFIAVGEHHVIREVSPLYDQYGQPYTSTQGETVGVKLEGIFAHRPGSVHRDGHFSPRQFRKVQRRDLTEWLATKSTIEEPKRTPAKRRERA